MQDAVQPAAESRSSREVWMIADTMAYLSVLELGQKLYPFHAAGFNMT